MPSLTPAELQEARRRSGRLGGRPKTATPEEARVAKLKELVPRALLVLEANLDAEAEHVRQRAAENILDRAWGRPTQVVEQTPTADPTAPWANLTAEERRALIATISKRLKAAETESGESDVAATG